MDRFQTCGVGGTGLCQRIKKPGSMTIREPEGRDVRRAVGLEEGRRDKKEAEQTLVAVSLSSWESFQKVMASRQLGMFWRGDLFHL